MKSIIGEIAIKNNGCIDAMHWLNDNKTHTDKWLYDNCTRPDWIVWWLYKSEILLSKKTWVNIAVICAEQTLQIYENKYPNDFRPRQAIETAKNWIKNPTANATAAANAAAYAALAAANATAAANAAAYAALAAAYAAYATNAAAYDAANDAAYAAANAAYYATDEANAAAYAAAQIKKLISWRAITKLLRAIH